MTLPEITYDLWEAIRSSRIVTDDNIDYRNLANWVHNQRALWLKRNIDKYQYLDDNICQDYEVTLDNVSSFEGGRREITSGMLTKGIEYTIVESELGVTDFTPAGATNDLIGTSFIAYDDSETYPSNEVTWGENGKLVYYIEIESPINVVKSLSPITPLLELAGEPAILEITSNDVTNKEFQYVPYNQLRWSGNGKFNSQLTYVSLRNGYIYLKYGNQHQSPNNMRSLLIRGVFQTPTEVPGYDEEKSNYPVNRHILDYMKARVLELDLAAIKNSNDDEIANNKDDV